MTRAEYLMRRGWTHDASKHWRDPLVGREAQPGGESGAYDGYMVGTAEAVIIQRSRDAVEERAAWVRFAAARMAIGVEWVDSHGNRHVSGAFGTKNGGNDADAMIAEYRARFAAPDRFDDEVTP